MKISKIFTGLVVCGALVFPGALSSSAQEIDPSESPESVNYSTEQETELLITNRGVAEDWFISKEFYTYQGPTVEWTETRNRPEPYAPYVYKGTLFYNSGQSTSKSHVYMGYLILQK
ncbi:hypothetical protein [Lysinibacillus sp. G4S2]|uniref:hypothetical protein n=1 Tax=Lysinibacillus sp. G4S2 TaxID=3055859 RepID=UPI0025A1E4FB|nr:hypothetical protein [Lysinibacillus sp. G4S2]MDM5250304.1 hypothetical protein [Lysinibacillus sp. G4S2]